MPTPMRSRSTFPRLTLAALTLAAVTLSLCSASQAQTESIIYNFAAGHDGHTPYAGLVFDGTGNLYGTTFNGGVHNDGTIFRLSPVTGAGWNETILHSFTLGLDGGNPSAPLILDAAGNLYGTTPYGGVSNQGVAFELSPITGGGWHMTILHSFTDMLDGGNPSGALVFDAAGNLYGATSAAGAHGRGTIFELSPSTGGPWHFKLLKAFTGHTDGSVPFGALTIDAAGNLYGTTGFGGNPTGCVARELYGCGVVFELSPVTGGAWHETVLYRFTGGTDGAIPVVGPTLDASGNIYGTTSEGGNLSDCPGSQPGCGVVYELSFSGGTWNESVLHAFTGGSDGMAAAASVTLDSLGNVYGTTEEGGNTTISACNPNGCGVVYELAPVTGGGWSETVLHSFTGPTIDGSIPAGSVLFDSLGNLYSTTAGAGAFGQGTVFEITP